MSERIPVKIEGRTERVAWLDAETARQVVAEGLGSYLEDERSEGVIETAAVDPQENAAARTGRGRPRQVR